MSEEGYLCIYEKSVKYTRRKLVRLLLGGVHTLLENWYYTRSGIIPKYTRFLTV